MNQREVDVGEHDGSVPLASDTQQQPRSSGQSCRGCCAASLERGQRPQFRSTILATAGRLLCGGARRCAAGAVQDLRPFERGQPGCGLGHF